MRPRHTRELNVVQDIRQICCRRGFTKLQTTLHVIYSLVTKLNSHVTTILGTSSDLKQNKHEMKITK